MKIKNIQQKKYKLLKINIIKSKILRKNHYFKNIALEDIEFRFKKILNLIYLYHISNKKILFIGNPLYINNKMQQIFLKTKHVFIPTSLWIPGMLTNKNIYLKSLFKQKTNLLKIISKKMLQLKKKSDLIVIIDSMFNKNVLEESNKIKIPTIALNSDLNILNKKINYKVPGNFVTSKTKTQNSLFYSILLSIIKKSNFIKTKFKNNVAYKLNSIKKIHNKKSFNKKYFYAFSKKK